MVFIALLALVVLNICCLVAIFLISNICFYIYRNTKNIGTFILFIIQNILFLGLGLFFLKELFSGNEAIMKLAGNEDAYSQIIRIVAIFVILASFNLLMTLVDTLRVRFAWHELTSRFKKADRLANAGKTEEALQMLKQSIQYDFSLHFLIALGLREYSKSSILFLVGASVRKILDLYRSQGMDENVLIVYGSFLDKRISDVGKLLTGSKRERKRAKESYLLGLAFPSANYSSPAYLAGKSLGIFISMLPSIAVVKTLKNVLVCSSCFEFVDETAEKCDKCGSLIRKVPVGKGLEPAYSLVNDSIKPLSKVCPSCSSSVSSSTRYCPHCSQKLNF